MTQTPGNDSAIEPIHILGPEQGKLNPTLPDGGLPPVYGVQNFQVFRATRARPDLADGRGWTYNHHVDMACWKGLLYVGWESGEKDEDIWPGRELFSTSVDGAHWSTPDDLFPQGIGTPLRTYFFHAPNGRMLALTGFRLDHEQTTERRKGPLIVREIRADHSLATIFTLLETPGLAESKEHPPLFTTSPDKGFVQSCEQLLANRPFLEQQDYGNLLGSRGMKWHDAANWPQGRFNPDDVAAFGKAMSFYHRKDGQLVGIGKKGWVTISADEGNSWTQPVIPGSLVTGMAKVWGQRTGDGRYVLVYNPKKRERYPLVAVVGDDGANYKNMRVVHGETPIQRYKGRVRDLGPQYIRGISEWASDGSRRDRALWLVYSMNEEDIWVSRVPLPLRSAETNPVKDDFHDVPPGPYVPKWNIYSPRWAPVTIEEAPETGERYLRLEDFDPYDYACATRLFPEGSTLRAVFSVKPGQTDHGSLQIELFSALGDARPVRLILAADGTVKALNANTTVTLISYKVESQLDFQIDVDGSRQVFTVTLNGKTLLKDAAFAEPATSLQRIVFRTGDYRTQSVSDPIVPDTDRPNETALFRISHLQITHH